MTPVMMADGLLMPALSNPGTPGPNGGPGGDQAHVFPISDQESANGLVVAKASPSSTVAPTSTADSPAIEVKGAGRSDRNGQGSTVGESVVRFMEALHKNDRRIAGDGGPSAATEPVKLVVPGPADMALAPPGQRSDQQAGLVSKAILPALRELYDHTVTVNLAITTASTATGTLKTLTERMG